METPEQADDRQASATGMREKVDLESPIVRDGENISTVYVRKPKPAELTGLSLRDIEDMQTDAMLQLLPRITEPSLLAIEIAMMDSPADFLALAVEARGFFLPKVLRPASLTE